MSQHVGFPFAVLSQLETRSQRIFWSSVKVGGPKAKLNDSDREHHSISHLVFSTEKAVETKWIFWRG